MSRNRCEQWRWTALPSQHIYMPYINKVLLLFLHRGIGHIELGCFRLSISSVFKCQQGKDQSEAQLTTTKTSVPPTLLPQTKNESSAAHQTPPAGEPATSTATGYGAFSCDQRGRRGRFGAVGSLLPLPRRRHRLGFPGRFRDAPLEVLGGVPRRG